MTQEEFELFNRLAYEWKRVIYGSCFYWFCRMCGMKGDSRANLMHEEYCPVGKVTVDPERKSGES